MLIILPKGKIFGIYRINDEILNKKDELKFNSLLNHEIKKVIWLLFQITDMV